MSAPLRLAVDGTPLLGDATGVGEVAHGLLDAPAGRTDLDLVVYALTFRGRQKLADRIPPGVRPAVRAIPARLIRALWLHSDMPRVEFLRLLEQHAQTPDPRGPWHANEDL